MKWGKETFDNVEANTDEDPVLFKAQLFALTGVQNERQKVMVKGVTLKDNEWGKMQLKDVRNSTLATCLIFTLICLSFTGCSCAADGQQRGRCS